MFDSYQKNEPVSPADNSYAKFFPIALFSRLDLLLVGYASSDLKQIQIEPFHKSTHFNQKVIGLL